MKLKWLVHSNLKEEDELRPVDGIARGVIWGILICNDNIDNIPY